MAPMAALGAPLLADAALAGRTGPMRVLDLAAGHGLYGIAVAKQNPGTQITALDWAAVLEVAEENAHMRKVRTTLNPDGRAVILEMAPNDDRVATGGRGFQFNDAAQHGRGRCLHPDRADEVLRDAGFARSEAYPLIPTLQSAIIAEV